LYSVKATGYASGLTKPYKGFLLAAPQGAAFTVVQAWRTELEQEVLFRDVISHFETC